MSDLTSRAFGLGLSDLFGVGLASQTAVPCLSACLFGVQAAVQSDRIIVRSRMPPQAGRLDSDSQLFGILAPAPGYLNTTGDNNVSVGYYAVTTVTTKSELLFAIISLTPGNYII